MKIPPIYNCYYWYGIKSRGKQVIQLGNFIANGRRISNGIGPADGLSESK